MIQKRNCILVCSDMNTWIDFCILVSDKDFNKAMEVTAKAYDDWWDSEEADYDIPIAEYIGMELTENNIEFDMYFNNDEEEE